VNESDSKIVLLVDNEPVVRRFIETVLGRHGYKTVSAGSHADALVRLESVSRIDLLLTDVVMPAMEGIALAREIVSRRPATHVVFMSANCGDEYRFVTSAPLLEKPFKIAELLAAIAIALRPQDNNQSSLSWRATA
jgi:two-component system, cell cycle sensor histidine kinase and response regulator CckA